MVLRSRLLMVANISSITPENDWAYYLMRNGAGGCQRRRRAFAVLGESARAAAVADAVMSGYNQSTAYYVKAAQVVSIA